MGEGNLSMEKKKCVVCVEDIDGVKRLHAVGPCNHTGVCSLCYLRLRQLMKEDTCVLCKTVMDRVMVCSEENIKPFEEYQIWGDNAGPEYDWDDKARMFLPKVYNRTFVRPLQEYRCGVEECPRPKSNSLNALEKHLREQHRLHLCKVCLTHRKVFLMEQVRYTQLELQQHIVSGDPQLGQSGHPRCEFCKCRFYDATQLHEHLVKDHYSCHICEKNGILHKYYRDYTDLERHFRADHFLCEEEACLEKKFVVFDSEIDLAGHMIQMHPNRPAKRQIQVNFKVKRSNWDGTGDDDKDKEEKKQDEEVHEWTYEGEIGEQTQPPEVLAARREAARRAAREGGMIGLPAPAPAPAQPADDFPTLTAGAGGRPGAGGPRQTSGWANLANARPRTEDFPALAGRRDGSRGGATFRSAVEAYPTRAQEIAMSGAGEGGWCFDYPMPPPEQTGRNGSGRSSGGGGGGGGGGGRGKVAGIGNMKFKVDKRAAKKNKQKAGAVAAAPATGEGGKRASSDKPRVQQQQMEAGVAASVSSSPPAAVVEDFPLAPGMKEPQAQAGQHTSSASDNEGQTLAQSIAAQQREHMPTPQGAAGAGPPSAVMELRSLLDEEAFSEVKEMSAAYRSGWLMPGEYLKAMEERLPADRFGELFEGLIDTLPDEDKRREMKVLLAASRAVKAKAAAAAAKRANKKKAASAAADPAQVASGGATNSVDGVDDADRALTQQQQQQQHQAQEEAWPGIGEALVNGSSNNSQTQKSRGKASKSNGSAAARGSNGSAKAGARGVGRGGGAGGGAGKAGAGGGVKAASPGSAATWLKAMGTQTPGPKTGGTGISVVRQPARSSNPPTGSGSSTITAIAGGYSGSRLQCNPGVVKPRSESPPPGVPLRRRDQEEEVAGIGQAGASWATQGGSGFRGSKKGAEAAAGIKVNRSDFPGLPGGGGGGALKADPADFPNLPAEGAGMGGLGGGSSAFKVKPREKPPAPPPPQRTPTQDDFPGLPMPAPPPPGMERVQWGGGGAGGDSGSQRGGGGGGGGGGVGWGATSGKGTKKKNKQKAEKDALKGMAFGFR